MSVEKLVVVGGVAGGASCAVRARRQSESARIVMFERGPHVSYANCGLPYYVGGVIRDRAKLLVASVEMLRQQFQLDVRVRHEVLAIDRQARKVRVRNLESSEEFDESYDALVLSPGASPLRPPLPGIDRPGIFTVRSIPDVDSIKEWMDGREARRAVVVGGGFIGLEMAENLRLAGLEVTIVEMLSQVLPPLDAEVAAPIHQHLAEHGVKLALGDGVASFEEASGGALSVVTRSGARHETDVVVLAIGVRPEAALARQAGLELGARGGIRVDERMRTSDPAIYAVGDVAEVKDFVTGQPTMVPLAGPANRQGRIAADVIMGREARYRGSQGTSVVQVFDLTVAWTGATEKRLREAGIAYEKAYLYPLSHAGYYPGAEPLAFKLLFEPASGLLFGAQAVGKDGVARRIDVVAMALQKHGTVFDLEEAELCYSPQHGSAKDAVNMAGFIAANHVRGDSPLVHWEALDGAAASGRPPLVLDVRNLPERQGGAQVEGAMHIPLPELRARLGELPKGREIWVHCAMGQRAHYATRILRQRGFDARNLSGGFRLRKARG